jgi:hypothetical protein
MVDGNSGSTHDIHTSVMETCYRAFCIPVWVETSEVESKCQGLVQVDLDTITIVQEETKSLQDQGRSMSCCDQCRNESRVSFCKITFGNVLSTSWWHTERKWSLKVCWCLPDIHHNFEIVLSCKVLDVNVDDQCHGDSCHTEDVSVNVTTRRVWTCVCVGQY